MAHHSHIGKGEFSTILASPMWLCSCSSTASVIDHIEGGIVICSQLLLVEKALGCLGPMVKLNPLSTCHADQILQEDNLI